MADVDPMNPIYDPGSPGLKITRRWGVAGAVFAVVSVLACVLANRGVLLGKLEIVAIAGTWALGAPVWFWYEYFYLYRRYASSGSWDLFKHGQQLSIAIWAGFATSLGLFAASPFSEPPKSEVPLECNVRSVSPTNPVPGQQGLTPLTVVLTVECGR